MKESRALFTKMNRIRYTLQAWFSAFVALIGLFFVMAAIGDLLKPEETDTELGVLLGLLVFFGGLTIAGIYLFFRWRRIASSTVYEEKERRLLELIAEIGSEVTPEEIAVKCPFTVDEVQAFLDHLCSRGSGEIKLTDCGKRVYHIFGFVSNDEKKTAESLL